MPTWRFLAAIDDDVVHDVLIVNNGLVGNQVILLIVRHFECLTHVCGLRRGDRGRWVPQS